MYKYLNPKLNTSNRLGKTYAHRFIMSLGYVNLINQIKLPGNVINEYRVNVYIFSSAGGDSAADCGRGFECLFKTLTDLVKTKLDLGFIVDIARLQLTQKSSNLVMFWLPKNALKFH